MEIKFASKAQCRIADLLWEAQTQKEVDTILRVFGQDAQVVYDMMIAATFDQVDNTHDADRVISKFRLTQ